jgi:type I restriction enzyme S subunit
MSNAAGPPASWTLVRLEDVADLQLGKMLDKARPKGSPHPYLRNINVRWDAVDTTDVLSMAFEDAELERFSIHDGDLLVCEGGEPGRAAIWKYGPTDLRFQKALHRVRFLGGISGRWAMYQLMLDAST